MPLDARGIELNDPGRINRELQKLRREIEALRSERRASATTIGDGGLRLTNGGSLVVDGGDVLMLDIDGSVMLRIGDQPFGDRGVAISRADGTVAIAIRNRFPGATSQPLTLYDDNENILLSESEFGTGLDFPWMPLVVQPWSATPTTVQVGPHGFEGPAVTSATFTTTHTVDFARVNQHSRWRFAVAASDTTTSGEIRVVQESSGGVLGPIFAGPWIGVRPVGSTGYTAIDPGAPLVLPGAYRETVRLLVQVRRTAGSGSLRCAVPLACGYSPTY